MPNCYAITNELTLRLQRAEAVIEIQKKVALLLGLLMPSDEES